MGGPQRRVHFRPGRGLVQGGRKTFGIYLQRGDRGLRKKSRRPYYGKRPLLCKRKGTGTRRVRKGTARPDLDARAQEEVTPKNAATEKQNEIPGRQITPEPDPPVEIRSAVHKQLCRAWWLCRVRITGCILERKNVITLTGSFQVIMTIRTDPCALSATDRICIIFSMGRVGRTPRRKCFGARPYPAPV